MKKSLFDSIQDRRSFYAIGNNPDITAKTISDLVQHALTYTPSAFHSQSARVLLLFAKEHEALWDLTMDTLRAIVPPDKFAPTEAKINAFKAGFGTVLFFEDQDTVSALQNKFPSYSQNFPRWSLQSSGMLQNNVWMLLEDEGLGASLQHYNPLIDDKVKAKWDIPASWELLAQMPFGKPLAQPDAKTFLPLEGRIKIFGNE